MTTLLTPKTNNQPPKKSLKKSCTQLRKSCQKWQNSDFQSQFSMSKNIRSFLKKIFSEEYDFRGTLFVIDIFGKLQFFDNLFLKMTANF